MLDDPLTDPKVLAERNKGRRKRERERERKAASLEGRQPVFELQKPGRKKLAVKARTGLHVLAVL